MSESKKLEKEGGIMKKKIRLLLIAAILFVPAVVFGQGSGSIESPSPTRVGGAERDESNFVVTRAATGTIVGLKDGILTIRTKKDKELTIALTNKTKYRQGKETLEVDELKESLFKEGQQVKITYQPLDNPKTSIDKIAVEVRFVEDNSPKEKPKIS